MITRTGIRQHVSERINLAKVNLKKLTRFRDLPAPQRIYLIKTLIIPLITYPPTPICTASKTQLKKMQSTINKYIKAIERSITPEDEEVPFKEEILKKYNITPLNILINERAKNSWANYELNFPEKTEHFQAVR